MTMRRDASISRSPHDRISVLRLRSRRGERLGSTELIARESEISSAGFGIAAREAIERRVNHLVGEGLAQRQGQRLIFARDLLNTLRRRDLVAAASRLSVETGLLHRPSSDGEHVAGIYRQRLVLASGRFAMIDDGMGFQLVPWRPALERHLGREVSGIATAGGRVTWSFERNIGLGI